MSRRLKLKHAGIVFQLTQLASSKLGTVPLAGRSILGILGMQVQLCSCSADIRPRRGAMSSFSVKVAQP